MNNKHLLWELAFTGGRQSRLNLILTYFLALLASLEAVAAICVNIIFFTTPPDYELTSANNLFLAIVFIDIVFDVLDSFVHSSRWNLTSLRIWICLHMNGHSFFLISFTTDMQRFDQQWLGKKKRPPVPQIFLFNK